MVRRPRTPGATRTRRSEESAALKRHWDSGVKFRRRSEEDQALNDGYRYLQSISVVLGPEYELFSQALFSLQVLGLDKRDWRRRLDKLGRMGGGSTQDNFAFGMMRNLIEERGITNVKRAAEMAVAQMHLYPDAAGFHSAVTRCRSVWQKYKAGAFQPKGAVVEMNGLFVRPRQDNLRRDEVREILDPEDMRFLPKAGKRVADTSYWRSLVELGFVEIVQNG